MKLNFKVNEKYILLDILKKIPKNFLNQKEVEFETIDQGNMLIIKVYYKNVFQFEVKLITSKGLCEIVEIKWNT